ncbi:hypothetical protein Btru_042610 [Bulinus truncatus]|nr:hypothetical protein Btru_042610 [Bulinus truncatus]
MFLIAFVLCAVLVTCEATPSVNLSQAVKNAFLKGHNDARDKLGIPPLVWDEKLSSFAAKAGTACQFQHSGGPYGENVYASYPDTNKYEEVARKAVSNWVNEKKYIDPKWNCVTRTTNTCGHYSQVIWRKTTSVGCAILRCGGSLPIMVFCEYNPRGNYIGQSPYVG